MPFNYLAASSKELRQGEILSNLCEYRPDNPVANHKREGSSIPVIPIIHPRVTVISQDCDLLSDFKQRESGNTDHPNIINCLLLCELFEEGDIRQRLPGSDVWKRIFQNQDVRYYRLPAGPIEDGSSGDLPELYLDFKRIVPAAPCDIYEAINLGQTVRVAIVPDVYIHDLVQRFYAFHSRVALPPL